MIDGFVNIRFIGEKIRTVTIDKKTFFCAKDVASALGFKHSTTAIKDHCSSSTFLAPIPDSLDRNQMTKVIDYEDLLRLVIYSNTSDSMEFKDWFFSEMSEDILNRVIS